MFLFVAIERARREPLPFPKCNLAPGLHLPCFALSSGADLTRGHAPGKTRSLFELAAGTSGTDGGSGQRVGVAADLRLRVVSPTREIPRAGPIGASGRFLGATLAVGPSERHEQWARLVPLLHALAGRLKPQIKLIISFSIYSGAHFWVLQQMRPPVRGPDLVRLGSGLRGGQDALLHMTNACRSQRARRAAAVAADSQPRSSRTRPARAPSAVMGRTVFKR